MPPRKKRQPQPEEDADLNSILQGITGTGPKQNSNFINLENLAKAATAYEIAKKFGITKLISDKISGPSPGSIAIDISTAYGSNEVLDIASKLLRKSIPVLFKQDSLDSNDESILKKNGISVEFINQILKNNKKNDVGAVAEVVASAAAIATSAAVAKAADSPSSQGPVSPNSPTIALSNLMGNLKLS